MIQNQVLRNLGTKFWWLIDPIMMIHPWRMNLSVLCMILDIVIIIFNFFLGVCNQSKRGCHPTYDEIFLYLDNSPMPSRTGGDCVQNRF